MRHCLGQDLREGRAQQSQHAHIAPPRAISPRSLHQKLFDTCAAVVDPSQACIRLAHATLVSRTLHAVPPATPLEPTAAAPMHHYTTTLVAALTPSAGRNVAARCGCGAAAPLCRPAPCSLGSVRSSGLAGSSLRRRSGATSSSLLARPVQRAPTLTVLARSGGGGGGGRRRSAGGRYAPPDPVALAKAYALPAFGLLVAASLIGPLIGASQHACTLLISKCLCR